MSELEDKLNSLLSDPAGMAQVMQLAQQLSSSMGQSAPQQPPEPEKPANSGNWGSLLGGIDAKTISKFLPILQAFSADQSNSMQLLNALKPYLKEDKQSKVERAARLARLITIGKRFLTEWEG